ncbi:hypothetical protein evm_015243, partial [Chilo suppressalis]
AEGTGGADLQRKLDLLNGALDAERAEQARRQMQYIAHSGYSEDSDYTSDLNYPVGQHANCSASQFRTAAHQMHTPQVGRVICLLSYKKYGLPDCKRLPYPFFCLGNALRILQPPGEREEESLEWCHSRKFLMREKRVPSSWRQDPL